MVTIYHDFKPVAAHGRTRKHGDRRTVNDHLPPDAQAFFAHDRAWCLEQARRVGPACAELIERLLADRIVERLRAAQGVLRLQKAYAASRLEAACARALLDRQFAVSAPNRVWVTDITYVATDEGWLYLAGIKDLFNGELVGYALDERMT